MIALPPDLTAAHISAAVDRIEAQTSDLIEVHAEQINAFSMLVQIYGAKALHELSPYKKLSQFKFPDLSLGGIANPSPAQSLESKASIRGWNLQSHYDHTGWFIVWRYLVDRQRQRPVVIWRVDVAFLTAADWKYEASTAGSSGGGRTHTFGLRTPSTRLRGCAAYHGDRSGHPKLFAAQ